MTLLGPAAWCCYAKRNGSEPLLLHLKYYFIAHREDTEAAGKQRGGRAAVSVRLPRCPRRWQGDGLFPKLRLLFPALLSRLSSRRSAAVGSALARR